MASPNDDKIFRICPVEDVDDNQNGLRIKVRLNPEDNNLNYDDIPWCFPLIPKHLHVNPKVGEMVLVLLSRMGVSKSSRWFIGPIISQQYFLEKDLYLNANMTSTKPLPDPSKNPKNEGSYPDRDDIAIQGRNNADLIFKRDEVRLRCGFKKNSYSTPEDSLLFNTEDLAYIQMRYRAMIDKQNNQGFASTINIVADRINLLSHDSETPFKLNDRKDLITDEELQKILENEHPLVYGDKLIDFLKQLIEVIRTHKHSFAMDPPKFSTPQTNVLNTNLDKMLSQSIRIN